MLERIDSAAAVRLCQPGGGVQRAQKEAEMIAVLELQVNAEPSISIHEQLLGVAGCVKGKRGVLLNVEQDWKSVNRTFASQRKRWKCCALGRTVLNCAGEGGRERGLRKVAA